MTPLEELMQRRWILKSEDSTLYYKVKDAMKDIRKIMQEKLGYIIIVNPYLIKLEKIPGKAEPWMGIQDFHSVREYQLFCYLLMYLDDKEREEQFVLSWLTEYIQVQAGDDAIDWNNLTTRRQLIRVMKYAMTSGLIKKDDGDEDRFAQDQTNEVLYENTGISRYFLRNFMKEIMDYKTPQDFEKSEWLAMEEDRGIVRRQRIYRRLLLSPGVYREEQDDDFLYIRNYRKQIQHDFQSFFPCELHLHRSSAYLNLMEDCSMGKAFPSNNTMSDLILLIHHEIKRRVKSYQLKVEGQEQILLQKEVFLRICERTIQQNLERFAKKYRDKGKEQTALEVMQEMEKLGFLKQQEESEMIILYPVVGKLVGNYQEGR